MIKKGDIIINTSFSVLFKATELTKKCAIGFNILNNCKLSYVLLSNCIVVPNKDLIKSLCSNEIVRLEAANLFCKNELELSAFLNLSTKSISRINNEICLKS